METYKQLTVKAVVLDWTGTTVDYGCQAPLQALTGILAERGIDLTPAEARIYLGLTGREYLERTLRLDRVRRLWRRRYGRSPGARELNALYEDYRTLLMKTLPDFCALTPGVRELCSDLRERGIRIGASSSHPWDIVQIAAEEAASHGYVPDGIITPDHLPAGKPYPWMAYAIATALEAYPMHALIKVGDTPGDMYEARNALMWGVGVVMGGNTLGMSADEIASLNAVELRERVITARERFFDAGAHYVIDTLADLPPVIDQIEQRLAAGEPSVILAPWSCQRAE